MTNDQYTARKTNIIIKSNYIRDDKIAGLQAQYIAENAKAKIGDIVTDGRGYLIVENVVISECADPYIYYSGIGATKEHVPKKSGETLYAHQTSKNFKIIKARA